MFSWQDGLRRQAGLLIRRHLVTAGGDTGTLKKLKRLELQGPSLSETLYQGPGRSDVQAAMGF